MLLSGRTTLVGLIGWPVGHSVSPVMHNAAFAELGLDWCYAPLPVNPEPAERVGEAVRGLRGLGLRGANVTVPHKQAVMRHLDRLTAAAQTIGAVNTILVEPDGMLVGDNTDAPGFIADLRDHGVDPAGRRVLVLGAGGSARAVVYGLSMAGAEAIVVANRTRERAVELADEMRATFAGRSIDAAGLPGDLASLATTVDLIVNCTSLGMTPHVETTPWEAEIPFRRGQVVYDLVYNPAVTQLLAQAERQGAQAIGGIGMLLWQGALAFQRWTGQPAPIGAMRSALAAKMQQAAGGAAAAAPPAAPPAGERPRHAAGLVRPAQPADAPAIAALSAVIQQVHADAYPEFFKPASPAPLTAAAVAELIGQPDTALLVVEGDGKVAGYLYGDTAPALETTSTYEFPRFYIHHIAVAPAWQGTGCGTALIEAANELARARGIVTLAVSVWDFNTAAREFFRSQGFVDYNHRMWLRSETDLPS